MKKIIILICIVWSQTNVQAQDIHFSHIHASPIHLNPAMTGMFQDAEVRLIANSRMQWETFTKGYKTAAVSADMKLFELNNAAIMSGGIQLAADRAGDLNFSTNTVDFNLSVQQAFDASGRNIFSVGFKGGLLNHRIDYSKMEGYATETELLESAPSNLNTWDLGAGVTYFHKSKHKEYFYVGASLFHINEPEISFFGTMVNPEFLSDGELGKILYRKWVVHGGGKFKFNNNISALPSFIFLDQGPHKEIKVGSFIKYRGSSSMKKNDFALYIGGWIRSYIEKDIFGTDAIDVSLRIDQNKTIYTFSFDFNTSKLRRASNGLGGPELSVIKLIEWNKLRRKQWKVKCPAL